MKLSARNVMKGTVKSIDRGSVNALVKVDLGGPSVTSIITVEALDDLGLKMGDPVYAIVKASSVILATD